MTLRLSFTAQQLDLKIQKVLTEEDIEYRAAKLFLIVAKTQSFKAGNKRTGIFAANTLLLLADAGVLLTVPYSENESDVAENFNTQLAHAYINNDDDPVIETLVKQGISVITKQVTPSSALSSTEKVK